MSRVEHLPPKVMLEAAKKVAEAAGLLAAIKPYCKRAGSLTRAEQGLLWGG